MMDRGKREIELNGLKKEAKAKLGEGELKVNAYLY